MLARINSRSVAVTYDATLTARPAPVARRKRWFARFMFALCESRRKSAEREIARYHDLIDLERRYDDLVWRKGNLPFPGP